MTGFTPRIKSFVKGSTRPKTWLVLSLALVALLAWGGLASAAELADHPKPEPGVLIAAVGEETAAAEAGLARGDVLLAIDGDGVNTAAELQYMILMHEPGDTLALTVLRGGEELTLTVTLGDRDGYPLLGLAPHSPQFGRMRTNRFRSSGMPGIGGMAGGAVVVEVNEDGPAAAAELKSGDVITAIDGTEIESFEQIVRAVPAFSPGDGVQLTVDRDGEEIAVTVTLGANPDDEEKAFLGARIMPLGAYRLEMGRNGFDRDSDGRMFGGNRSRFGFGFPNGRGFASPFSSNMMTEGALVMGVQEDGPAALSQLTKGDVITAVDETEIANFEQLVEALANYSPGDGVQVTVDRDGEIVTSTVTLGAHPEDETKAYLGVMIMPVERLRMEMEESEDKSHEDSEQRAESERDS
jgi:S1-C subfamily serine protease